MYNTLFLALYYNRGKIKRKQEIKSQREDILVCMEKLTQFVTFVMTLKAKKKNYIKVLYDLFITVKSSQDTFCWVSTEEKEGMSNYF